ncbi:MAG: hypothetical protein ACFFD4_16725 [Candidatus Odinarchaeota archaeon]
MFNKKLTLGLMIIIFTLSFSISSSGAIPLSSYLDLSSEPVVPVTLVDGAYGDFDGDSEIDDFCVWINFDFSYWELPKCVRISMLMIVTLPSGFEYRFSIDVWTRATGTRTLQIICYNGATESGWYEVELYGVINGLGDLEPIDDFISFDPPKPIGSGSPEAVALWTS